MLAECKLYLKSKIEKNHAMNVGRDNVDLKLLPNITLLIM